MKDSTYERVNRVVDWTRRIEPKWYLGCALGCALLGGLAGSSSLVVMGVMHLVMAVLASERNAATRQAQEWHDLADEWEDLYYRTRANGEGWRGLYFATKAANRQDGTDVPD